MHEIIYNDFLNIILGACITYEKKKVRERKIVMMIRDSRCITARVLLRNTKNARA